MRDTAYVNEQSNENYFIPMTDLLIGILFVFIIIIMVIIFNIDELRNSNKDEMEKNIGLSNRLKNASLINNELRDKINSLYEAMSKDKNIITALNEENVFLKNELTEEKEKHLQNMVELHTRINNFLAQSDSIKRELLREIQQDMKSQGFPTIVDEENGILRFADTILFQSGEYQLTEGGQKVLTALAAILEARLPAYVWQQKDGKWQCPRKACVEAVYVEGHTDKKPVQGNLKGGIRSNFELSSARALSTYRFFAEREKLNAFVNARGEKLIGVCGYGESRPIRPGDSDEDLRANRRIDLRFLMEAPHLDDIRDLAR